MPIYECLFFSLVISLAFKLNLSNINRIIAYFLYLFYAHYPSFSFQAMFLLDI